MPVIIDGYNLLHAARRCDEDGDLGRGQLCQLLGRWGRVARQEVLVVFDGAAPPEPLGRQLHGVGIEVIYSGPGRSADDLVVERIDASSAPRRLMVVSSDRQVRRAARRRRCGQVGSADFFEQVLRVLARGRRSEPEPPEKRAGPAPEEVDEWLRRFGYDGDAKSSDYREL